jgi:hypothetical protein
VEDQLAVLEWLETKFKKVRPKKRRSRR